MSKLDFLTASAESEPASEPEAAPAEPAAATDGQPRGPDGKFAAKEPQAPEATAETEPAPEPQPAPQPAETPPPAEPEPAPPAAAPAAQPEAAQQMVPLSALQAVRDEVKALKAQLPPAPKPAPVPRVDPEEDPLGAYNQERQDRFNTVVKWSKRLADAKHGEEAVNAAVDWGYARCNEDPGFNARVGSSQDPIGLVFQEFQQHQVLAALQEPAKRDRLLALLNDEAQPQPLLTPVAAPAAPAPVAPPSPPPTPPRSIASAPSAGGATAIPIGPGQAYSAALHKG